MESMAKMRAGLYSRAHIMAQRATGPQPITAMVISGQSASGVSRKAFLAALKL